MEISVNIILLSYMYCSVILWYYLVTGIVVQYCCLIYLIPLHRYIYRHKYLTILPVVKRWHKSSPTLLNIYYLLLRGRYLSSITPSPSCRIQQAEPEYQRVFAEELAAFIARIERRAKEKIAEAEKEAEEEERKERLGPGGLDPLEVLETLPQVREVDINIYLKV